MAPVLFLLACLLPSAVVVLSVAAIAVKSASRGESPARLREHHA